MIKVQIVYMPKLCVLMLLAAIPSGFHNSGFSFQAASSRLMLSASGEWTYSPLNPRRERSGILLYLRSDGKALSLLGNFFDQTDQVPPKPVLSTASLFKLEIGTWKQKDATLIFDFRCLGSMYVIAGKGKDPCGNSQLTLIANGMHLIGKNNSFEPVARIYPNNYKLLQDQFFAECCRNQEVLALFPECSVGTVRKEPN
jgi:hypothetical protein